MVKCEGYWRMTWRKRNDHYYVMRTSQNVLSSINVEVLLHQHLGALCSHYHCTHNGFFDYRDIIKPFWHLKSPSNAQHQDDCLRKLCFCKEHSPSLLSRVRTFSLLSEVWPCILVWKTIALPNRLFPQLFSFLYHPIFIVPKSRAGTRH